MTPEQILQMIGNAKEEIRQIRGATLTFERYVNDRVEPAGPDNYGDSFSVLAAAHHWNHKIKVWHWDASTRVYQSLSKIFH